MNRRGYPLAAWVGLLLSIFLSSGCASLPGSSRYGAVTVAEQLDQGDAERRASMRLVVAGLEADAASDRVQALNEYGAALRIDALNPYAYLAMARHLATGGDPERAFSFLDQAESLFGAQGTEANEIEAHLVGIRGMALWTQGYAGKATPYLERAQELAPKLWGDQWLSAQELLGTPAASVSKRGAGARGIDRA
jgi:tetratricopeptide (TPR) repeat protein